MNCRLTLEPCWDPEPERWRLGWWRQALPAAVWAPVKQDQCRWESYLKCPPWGENGCDWFETDKVCWFNQWLSADYYGAPDMSWGGKIISCGHEIAICSHKIISCGHEIAIRSHKVLICGHKILSRSHEIVIRSHVIGNLWPRNINLVPRNSNLWPRNIAVHSWMSKSSATPQTGTAVTQWTGIVW